MMCKFGQAHSLAAQSEQQSQHMPQTRRKDSDEISATLCHYRHLTQVFIFIVSLLSLQEKPFWFRCGYILIWGKIILYKYVTCWLVTVSLDVVPERPMNQSSILAAS